MKVRKFMSMMLAAVMLLTMALNCGAFAQGDDLSGTITVSVVARAGAEEGWKAVAEAYKAYHPNVDVVVDLKEASSYTEWVTTVINSDDPAVDIGEFGTASLSYVDFGDYMDLDSPYSDGTWRDQLDESAIGASLVTGEFDSLSLNSTQVTWMYNADIFAEVGVEPPTTWDELIDVCEKLQTAGYQPITIDGDYFGFTTMTLAWLMRVYTDQISRDLINVYRAQEGDFCYDPDVDGTWTYDPTDPWNDLPSRVTQNIVRVMKACKDGTNSLNTDAYKTMWTNLAKVFPKYAGEEAMFGTSSSTVSNVFYQGKAAMMINGGWGIIDYMRMMEEFEQYGSHTNEDGEVITGTIFTLGTFAMPSMTGDAFEAKARTIEANTQGFSVLAKSQEQSDLVMDFLMFYSSAEGMSIYLNAMLEAGGSIDGPVLVIGAEYPDEIAKAFENVEYLGNVQNGYTHVFASGVPYIEESQRALYNDCYAYFMGEITVDEFVDRAESNLETYLPSLMAILNISDADLENPAAAPAGN